MLLWPSYEEQCKPLIPITQIKNHAAKNCVVNVLEVVETVRLELMTF
jgi:hypothetical protein